MKTIDECILYLHMQQPNAFIKKLEGFANDFKNQSDDQKCWCGSEKLFYVCHKGRSACVKMSIDEMNATINNFFSKKKCSADFDSKKCTNKIINAHSISRSNVLKSIAQDNHVCSFYKTLGTGGSKKPKKYGVRRQASVFTGFCDFHDNSLFKCIEDKPFTPSLPNFWAASYRAICHEVFQKKALLEANRWKINNLDKGCSLKNQIFIQKYFGEENNKIIKGYKSALYVKNKHEEFKSMSSYGKLKTVMIELDCEPSVVLSGSITPIIYPVGNKSLQSESGQDLLQHLSISSVVKDNKPVILLSYLSEYKKIESYIGALLDEGEGFIRDWVFNASFAYIENTYFSAGWWDSLPKAAKKHAHNLYLNERCCCEEFELCLSFADAAKCKSVTITRY